jgi:hypothetical protein
MRALPPFKPPRLPIFARYLLISDFTTSILKRLWHIGQAQNGNHGLPAIDLKATDG